MTTKTKAPNLKKPVTLKSLEAELLEIFRRLGPIEDQARALIERPIRMKTYAMQDNLRVEKREALIAEAEAERDKGFARLEEEYSAVLGVEKGLNLDWLGDLRMTLGNMLRYVGTPNV